MTEQLLAIIAAGYTVTLLRWDGGEYIAEAAPDDPSYDSWSAYGETIESAVRMLHDEVMRSLE